jgi:hypothetical protein
MLIDLEHRTHFTCKGQVSSGEPVNHVIIDRTRDASCGASGNKHANFGTGCITQEVPTFKDAATEFSTAARLTLSRVFACAPHGFQPLALHGA